MSPKSNGARMPCEEALMAAFASERGQNSLRRGSHSSVCSCERPECPARRLSKVRRGQNALRGGSKAAVAEKQNAGATFWLRAPVRGGCRTPSAPLPGLPTTELKTRGGGGGG